MIKRQITCDPVFVDTEKKKPKVSVIVPVYNVEKYLSQCVESLKAQTLKEIEFIVINDRPTDSSCASRRAVRSSRAIPVS